MDQLISALDRKAKDLASRGLHKSPLRGSKIVVHGTKNQLRRRLPPLENCRSGCVLHDLFRLPATPAKVATHPGRLDARRAAECFWIHSLRGWVRRMAPWSRRVTGRLATAII